MAKRHPEIEKRLESLRAQYLRCRRWHDSEALRCDLAWNDLKENLPDAVYSDQQTALLNRIEEELKPRLALVPENAPWPAPKHRR